MGFIRRCVRLRPAPPSHFTARLHHALICFPEQRPRSRLPLLPLCAPKNEAPATLRLLVRRRFVDLGLRLPQASTPTNHHWLPGVLRASDKNARNSRQRRRRFAIGERQYPHCHAVRAMPDSAFEIGGQPCEEPDAQRLQGRCLGGDWIAWIAGPRVLTPTTLNWI